MKNKLLRRVIALGVVGLIVGVHSGSAGAAPTTVLSNTTASSTPSSNLVYWHTCWAWGFIPYPCSSNY